MKYALDDADIAAIKDADKDKLFALYVRLVADRTRDTDERDAYAGHISTARDNYTNDDLEIDDEPAVSYSDEGTWVAAWVWVANSEVEGFEDEDEANAA